MNSQKDEWKGRFENYEVACDLECLDPFQHVGEAPREKVHLWYKDELRGKGLEILSMSSGGIKVFPTGSRVWSKFSKKFVVPDRHIYSMSWGLVKVFLGYPPGLSPREQKQAQGEAHD